MATQTILMDVGRTSGTFTADVYPDTSSTAFATGVTVTADTVSGFYTLPLTSSSGLFRIVLKEAGARIGSFFVTTADITTTFAASSTREGAVLQNDPGKYGGFVWFDNINGTAGAVSYTNGTMTNPSSVVADTRTLQNALLMKRVRCVAGSTWTHPTSASGLIFEGGNYSVALNGNDISNCVFISARSVTGVGTSSPNTAIPYFSECFFPTAATIPPSNCSRSLFAGTTTLGAAGDYTFIDCCAFVPDTGIPTFVCPSGTANISFRRWSGSITITGITSTTTIAIDMVSGGTVTLSGADGNVQVRGMAAAVTDNRTGSPTLGQNGLLNRTTVATPTNITAGTITTVTNLTNLPSAPTDWLTGASVKADAVTKIQTGLATPTNITAGTIGTVGTVTSAVVLPTAPTDWISAAAVSAAAVAKVQNNLATAAGVTTAAGSVTLAPVTHTGAIIPNVTLVGTTTNLTNAATAGDFTATMKQSISSAVWDYLTASMTTAASIGKKLADWVIGTAQTGDSFARIGANGAGLTALGDSRLSNLDASISSLNNLSALMNIYGSPLLEIPDTGSTLFAFTLVVRDSEGKLVNLDAAPAITAANAAGTSRSANLSAISSPATGRYTFTYTVTSAAAEESLRIICSGAVSAENRYIEWIGAVVNYDSITTLAAIQSKTDLIQSFPANFTALGINSTGSVNRVVLVDTTTANTDMRGTNGANTVTPPTVAQIRAEIDTNSAQLAKLGTPTGANLSADIAAVKTDTGALLTRITSSLFSGITSLRNWLGMLAGKTVDATTLTEIHASSAGATYDNTQQSLEAIRIRGDAAGAGSGGGLTGANLVTITVTAAGQPVPGAFVRLSAGGLSEVKRTNGSGVVTFTVDNNTWSVRITSANLSFEATTLTVTGDTSASYAMTPVVQTGTTWATGEDLIVYYDAQTIGAMLRDDKTTVANADVPTHPVVLRMMLLATGAVNSALMQSKRYSADQLTALPLASREHLKNITCAVAMWHLGERRLPSNPDRQEAARKLAESHLERLRKGELVFDVDANKEAGLESPATYQPDYPGHVPLLRDEMSGAAGAFPRPRGPRN